MTVITRTPWIDEVPDVAPGTVINNAIKQELYDQIDEALATIDLALAGSGVTPAGTGYVHVTLGLYDVPAPTIPQADVTGLPASLALKADVTSLATKADLNSPTFTGAPAAPTPPPGDNSTKLATSAFVTAAVAAGGGGGGAPAGTGYAHVTGGAYDPAVATIPQVDVTGLPAALAAKADLASPAFSGTPTAPTPLSNDSSTKLATTAFTQAAVAAAAGGGGAPPGTGYVHVSFGAFDVPAPTIPQADVTGLPAALAAKADVTSPTFNGIPAAPTAPPGTNTTQIATTAFTRAAVATVAPPAGTGYVHVTAGAFDPSAPTIPQADVTGLPASLATKADLASPTFTGTPAAPTPAPGDNSTKLATTAFTAAAVALVPAGPAGPAGPQGDPGPAGGILTDTWVWTSPAVSAALAVGKAGLNHDTPSLATQVWVHKQAGSATGIDWSVVISSLAAGDKIYIQRKTDGTIYHRYTVTGVPTLNGATTWVIPVVFTIGNSEAANGADVVIAFQRQDPLPAHHTTHESGGTDAIKLDALAAPTDVTTLNVSTAAHGLTPKLPNDATKFLNGVGAWTVPAGSGGGGGGISQTIALTGTQNDLALTPGCTLLRCNNATLLTITGLAAGTDGQRLLIEAVAAGRIDILDMNVGSAAANRVANGVQGARSLVGGLGRIELVYDTTGGGWVVQQHEQGDWIAPPHVGANFIALFGGTGVWTVDAGDLIECRYYLRGRQLHVDLYIGTSTIGGSPMGQSIRVNAAAFGGYQLQATNNHFYPLLVQDNGTWKSGYMNHDNAGLYFQQSLPLTTSWTASVNLTSVQWSGIIAVQ